MEEAVFGGSSSRRWKISELGRDPRGRRRREEMIGGKSLLLMLMPRQGRHRLEAVGGRMVLLKGVRTGPARTAGQEYFVFDLCRLELPRLSVSVL